MTVLQLFPGHQVNQLHGLYLNLNLQRKAEADDLLIYSNYIASLDGRISQEADGLCGRQVPDSIINKRDWRLYQELAAQSDVVIASARYFRQLAQGCAQDLLPIGAEPEYADLLAWRKKAGLKPQPDVAVISNSLDIPVESLKSLKNRRVLIFTGSGADRSSINRLEATGAELLIISEPEVRGQLLKSTLIEQGYRSAYMIAGPQVHRMLLADQVLDYLFLTIRLRLIGGENFDTIMAGDIEGVADMQLCALYLDQSETAAQLFAQFSL